MDSSITHQSHHQSHHQPHHARLQITLDHLHATSIHLSASAPTTSAFIGAQAVSLTRSTGNETAGNAGTSKNRPTKGSGKGKRTLGRVEWCNACGSPLLPGWNARRRVVRVDAEALVKLAATRMPVVGQNAGGKGGEEEEREQVPPGQADHEVQGPEKRRRKSKRRKEAWDVRKPAKMAMVPGAAITPAAAVVEKMEMGMDLEVPRVGYKAETSPIGTTSQSNSATSHAQGGPVPARTRPEVRELRTTCHRCHHTTRARFSPPSGPVPVAVPNPATTPSTTTTPVFSSSTPATSIQAARPSQPKPHKKSPTTTASASKPSPKPTEHSTSRARAKVRKKSGLLASAAMMTEKKLDKDGLGLGLGLGLMDFMTTK